MKDIKEKNPTKMKVYPRIQLSGRGYDPEHKSYRPPSDWKPGMYIDPTEGELTEGMAAFHALPISELEKALDGDNFMITSKEATPLAMDWDEIETDIFTRNDALNSGYAVFLIYGEDVEKLPDGVIIKPHKIPDDWWKKIGLSEKYKDATREEEYYEERIGLTWSWQPHPSPVLKNPKSYGKGGQLPSRLTPKMALEKHLRRL